MIDNYHLLQDLILLNNPYVSAQSMSTRVVNQKKQKETEEQEISWLVLSH